jgi:poly-beta-1,6-N-acetyl-D-glucosamine biosynthesis protein PgaD
MRAERPIISHPEKQSHLQKILSVAITALAWATWGYIWLPTLSVISSVLGVSFNTLLVVRKPDETSLILIFIIMLACNFLISSWSSYNFIRFSKRSRRRSTEFVEHSEISAAFGVADASTQSALLCERRLALHFDDAGSLVRVEVLTGNP